MYRMHEGNNYPTVERFGSKLRALRTARGLTMRQLAYAIGFTDAHISDLENGKSRPGGELVLRVARFFGVSTDVLLDGALDLPDEASPK